MLKPAAQDSAAPRGGIVPKELVASPAGQVEEEKTPQQRTGNREPSPQPRCFVMLVGEVYDQRIDAGKNGNARRIESG